MIWFQEDGSADLLVELRRRAELLPDECAHGDVQHVKHLGEACGVRVLLRAGAAHHHPLHALGSTNREGLCSRR
jgi:hypothetical protein